MFQFIYGTNVIINCVMRCFVDANKEVVLTGVFWIFLLLDFFNVGFFLNVASSIMVTVRTYLTKTKLADFCEIFFLLIIIIWLYVNLNE